MATKKDGATGSNYEEFKQILRESKIDHQAQEQLDKAFEFNELHVGDVDHRELGRVVVLTGLAVLDCLRRLH